MNNISDALPASLVNAGQPAPQAKNSLGKDDFMKLLMAQLRNQDPLNPMDQQAFVAQLAQFGSLEQLTNIGTGIQNLRTGVGEGSKLQALGMIGKEVHAEGRGFDLVEGQSASLLFTPKAEVTPVKAVIANANGEVVREMELGGQANAAKGALTWDGKDSQGQALPAGKYSFHVQGVDAQGNPQDLSTSVTGRVMGVDVEGGQPVLIVQHGNTTSRLELSKVRQVSVGKDASASPAPATPTAPAATEIKMEGSET